GSAAGMTPLRWGTTYLEKAMTLTPEANDALRTDGDTILTDVLATSDAFAGGNWMRLQAIVKALDAWAKDEPARAAIAEALRAKLQGACPALAGDGDDSPGARCKSLFRPATAAG
ncbi:MAG TPA: hypothetical protein VKC62_07100, partial [Gaiellaceae bacterium]|nr:hypothetical protein [Gaiellaceae bacterium]